MNIESLKKWTATATAVLAISMTSGCQDHRLMTDPVNLVEYSKYSPILASRSELDKVSFFAPRPIVSAGKIIAYRSFLVVNEVDEGYHVIDNSDPTAPKKIGFLRILGSRSAVIRGTTFYSDNATDLISVDITDIQSPTVVSRLKGSFKEFTPPDGLQVDPEFAPINRPDDAVIVKWKKVR